MIQDEKERSKALDPTKSFIVQAPAGSGKTELLTQRILVLLARVKQPEEILAITFTKKSAAEMKDRIIKALQSAAHHPEPEAEHAKKTWHLAKQALKQDHLLQWNVLDNPNQLRIQTIDSFNSSLTKQLPILSHFGATPEIADDSFPLYQQAVQEFLSYIEENVEWADAIAKLLLHMDNNLTQVENLLINLLAKRDQWIHHITLNSTDDFLREKLESYLNAITEEALENLHREFPQKYTEELLFLVRYAAQYSAFNTAHLTDLPSDAKIWRDIATLLLTQDDTWRKTVNISCGFPPETHFKNKEEKNIAKETKARFITLIENLSQYEKFKLALTEIRSAPQTTYQESQWQTLEALHQILRIAVAQLKLTFQQHKKIDYIENSLAALTALGTEDAPTDLTLSLDYQIKHILIDEFQDTSTSQYRLIEKMIAGWESQDGRTLFLVGDPMQSIYLFREAEVGLFIRARQQGIGSVYLEPLTLSVNFRSMPGIVNWVNQHFLHVFPTFEDISAGAVSYSKSTPFHTELDTHAVKLHAFVDNPNAQASEIVSVISARKKAYPQESIAILVRSRTHLAKIIPALKAAHISYQAINIDPLTERPFIQDLISLTCALLHLADRVAWLSILRAPWSGLSLSDLFIISGDQSKICIWERLQSTEIFSQLSEDGKHILQRILPILKNKLDERYRFNLRDWVESTWLLLGGADCLEQSSDYDDSQAYFNLLEKLDQGGDLAHLDHLNQYVEKLFASPNNQADKTLQIMTIHNSKGLEFDTVIIPHLEKKSSNDEKELLRWMEQTNAHGESALIFAPVHATGDKEDSIYEYIKQYKKTKDDYEKSRLLYVAVTRAKKQINLFFNLEKKEEIKDPSNSLLEKLWPSIKNDVLTNIKPTTEKILAEKNSPEINPFIKRLSTQWKNNITENYQTKPIAYHQKNAGFLLSDNKPKIIGTMIHKILQHIGNVGFNWWEEKNLSQQNAYLKIHLTQLGLPLNELSSSIQLIQQAIHNTLNDKKGRWILHPHQEAKTEFALTALINQKPQQLVIDRTFVDENNHRWIIDYKNSFCDDENLEKFLDNEEKKYLAKLQDYSLAMSALDERPVLIGLYFPFMSAWRETKNPKSI